MPIFGGNRVDPMAAANVLADTDRLGGRSIPEPSVYGAGKSVLEMLGFTPETSKQEDFVQAMNLVTQLLAGGGIKLTGKINNPIFNTSNGMPLAAEKFKWIKNEVPSWETIVGAAKEARQAGFTPDANAIMQILAKLGGPEALADVQGGAEAIARKSQNIAKGSIMKDVEAPFVGTKSFDNPATAQAIEREQRLQAIADEIEARRVANAKKWKDMPEDVARSRMKSFQW